MRFVTFMCMLLSVIFILHSIPDDVYSLNLAIYALLFAVLLQLADINRKMKGE